MSDMGGNPYCPFSHAMAHLFCYSAALGQGWRLGFLGLLHMDVFVTRLEQEYNKSVIVTSPNVPYKVKIIGAKNIKAYRGDEVTVLNPCNVSYSALYVSLYC